MLTRVMELTGEQRSSLERSVLCWIATTDGEGQTNASPKEVFTCDRDRVFIAHIASPKTVRNIDINPHVMVSVVDVFNQEGWQFSGDASLVWADSPEFRELVTPLEIITQGKYPIKAVMVDAVREAQRIVAPSSWLFPDRPQGAVRQQVLSRYGLHDL